MSCGDRGSKRWKLGRYAEPKSWRALYVLYKRGDLYLEGIGRYWSFRFFFSTDDMIRLVLWNSVESGPERDTPESPELR